MSINLKDKKITLLLVFLLITSIVVMQSFDKPLKNKDCPNGIVSFELAKDISKTKTIINSWNESGKINASLSLGFDFFFILIYTLFIALMIYKINNKLWKNKPFYLVGKLLIYAIFLAGIADIIENIALINLLNGRLEQTFSTTAYYFASLKFSILLIGIFYLLINWLISVFKNIKTNH